MMPRTTTLLLLMSLTVPAQAELPSIRFDRIRPLGASVGQTVDVEIAGAEIDGVESLLFDHPGLSAEYLEEKKFRITVSDDVPPGTRDVRLVGRFGVSNPRLLAISRGLQEVPEQEPNNDAATAQEIPLNAAVNGNSDGNGEDFFVVSLLAGQRVTINCLARRLESVMDASLELTSETGQLLASNGEYYGADPFIDFVASAAGKYRIRLNDLRFRGGYPYRLIVSSRPHIETIHPRAIQAGQSVEVEVTGRNLGSSSQPVSLPGDGPPLDAIRRMATAAPGPLENGLFLFSEHPTGHSVLPTAATCTLNGFQLRPLDDALNALPILVCETPVTLEVENNDSPDKPQLIGLPAVVSGRFDRPRDGDWFQFEVTENGQYGFEVYSERINGKADPFVVILDDKDNRVSELDDYGHRINAFDGHLRDPSGSVGLSAGRKYRVLVKDRYSRGGARFQYVLSIRKPQPDWFAAAIHHQNPGPGGATIWKGSSTYLDVVIHQRDGFNQPITITAEGLPAGVTAVPTIINNNSRGTFVITAEPDSADWTGEVTLVSAAEVDGRKLRREVRPYARCWNQNNSSRPSRRLALAVRERAPFGLSIDPPQITVVDGKAAELTVRATRHQDGFAAKIDLRGLNLPSGFTMSNTTIADNGGAAKITINVQNGRPPGEYTMTVLGQAQVPFSKDPKAENRPNTLVSLPASPVTITVVKE